MKRNPTLVWFGGWGRAGALTLAALLVAPAAASAQLSVDELEVLLTPGGRTARALRVTNDSDRPQQVMVEIGDWDRDESGMNRFLPLGEHARSCRNALKAFPMSMRIEPRRTEVLRISFEGDSASAGCWGIVFVQSNEPTPRPETSHLTYTVRTGVKVYVQPQGAVREGDIEEAVLQAPDSLGVRRVEVAFRNSGEAHLRPRGVLELRRPDNTVAASVTIEEFPIVPGALRRLRVPLPKLEAGTYVALVMLDFGGETIAAGQVEVIIP